MFWFILGLLLLVLNVYLGVRHVQEGRTTINAALTWFAVGALFISMLI